jgi:uncharacterized protein YaaN involved in tellurite resistance
MAAAIDEEKVTSYVHFQVQRKITNLYKNCLVLIEDLKKPPHNLLEEEYKSIRKKILDYGNDALREIEEDFKKISIKLK